MKHYLPNDKLAKNPPSYPRQNPIGGGLLWAKDILNNAANQPNPQKPPYAYHDSDTSSQSSSQKATPSNVTSNQSHSSPSVPSAVQPDEQRLPKPSYLSPLHKNEQQTYDQFTLNLPIYEPFKFEMPDIKAPPRDTSIQQAYDKLTKKQEPTGLNSPTAMAYQSFMKQNNRPMYDIFMQNASLTNKQTSSTQPFNQPLNKIGEEFFQTTKRITQSAEDSRLLNQNYLMKQGEQANELMNTPVISNEDKNILLKNFDFGKSIASNIEKSIHFKNYKYNLKEYESNLKNKTAGPGIYINGQGREPYKNFKFGTLGNTRDNGCMSIALYNGLVSLNDYDSLPNINYDIGVNNSTIFGGKLGGNPTSIAPYLTSKGYDVDSRYFPDTSAIENAAKNGDTAILLYGYFVNKTLGAHYITIKYDENGLYRIYNDDNDETDSVALSELSRYSSSGKYPISVYSIKKRGKK